jgi:hypothetical protein
MPTGSGPLPNGGWYIRVVTINTYSNDGEPSNVLSLVMPGGGVPVAPGAPTLTAAQVSSSPISLTWAAGSGGAPTSYTLYAGTSPGGADLGAFPMGTATSISAAAPVGMRIYVRVVATNAVGSATSNEVNFQLSAPAAPGAPTMNVPVVAGRTVTFSWTPPASGNATSYLIEARLSATGPVFATLSATGTSTSVPGVPPGTYYVSVRALNGTGMSAASNQVTAVVP